MSVDRAAEEKGCSAVKARGKVGWRQKKEMMLLEVTRGDEPVRAVSGCSEKSKGKMTVAWKQSWC